MPKGKPPTIALLIGLGIIIGADFLSLSGLLEGLELKSLDLRFYLRGERPPRGEILIVAIDETSIEEIGDPWPWSISHHSRVIRCLSQSRATVIGFDLFLLEDIDEDEQKVLIDALRSAGNVVFASKLESNRRHIYSVEYEELKLQQPSPAIRRVALGCGLASMPYDER